MNPYDDELDQMLASLPLAEPPADLRARVLAATVRAPSPELAGPAIIAPWWESALYGVLAALVVWATLVVANLPAAGTIVAAGLTWAASAIQLPTLLWAAVGAGIALWYVTLTGSDDGRRLRT